MRIFAYSAYYVRVGLGFEFSTGHYEICIICCLCQLHSHFMEVELIVVLYEDGPAIQKGLHQVVKLTRLTCGFVGLDMTLLEPFQVRTTERACQRHKRYLYVEFWLLQEVMPFH